MPTRKELLEALVAETNELRSSVGNNTEASEALIYEVDRLQDEIEESSRYLATTSDRTIAEFSDRIADLRQALSEGAREIGSEILKGHLIGNIVGQVAVNALQNRATNPRNIMARRIHQAIEIIIESFMGGSRNDYDATLRILRAHEFKAEQARYIVDLLLTKHNVLAEFETEDGAEYIMIDFDSPTWIEMLEYYKKNKYVYLA